MKLKPYPKYKESGIQWIGKIPEEWEVMKVKHFSISIAGGTPDTNNASFWDGKIPWIPSGMVHNKPIYETEVTSFITLKGVSKSSAKWIKKDSVLVALTGATCGKIGYLTFRATANQSVIGIQPDKKTNSKYIFYYLLSQREQILLHQTGGAQAGINKEDVVNLFCAFPKKDEQKFITSFLDSRTSRIDKTIEKDKELIELLKEKRTALINHVVTKGLDSKAKMKDSGIDWIGKIPEEWEVNKIKNTSYIKGRIGWQGLTSEEYQEEGAYLVTGTNFKEGLINWDDCYHVSWERFKEDPYIHLREDDLLITKDGTIGKVALVGKMPDKATLNSGIFLVRSLNKKYDTRYMYWILNSSVFERFFDYIKTGATISHLYQETFERFFFPIPPKQIQLQIVEYLDKQTSRIDQTINKIQEKISLLEEYKKSLIHHVVTGKVDVRGVVT